MKKHAAVTVLLTVTTAAVHVFMKPALANNGIRVGQEHAFTIDSIIRPNTSSTILTNGIKLPNQRLTATKTVGCPDSQTTFVQAETQSFFIYICGDNYIGVAKNGSGSITLSLVKFNAIELEG